MEIKIKGIYKHFKGDYYIVEDIGYNCDNLKPVVIYRSLYEDGKLWVRDLDDFLSEIDKNKYPNTSLKYKFTLQNIESKRKR